MRRHTIVALAALAVVCSLASTTHADCEQWGEWAYDYRCGDSTPAFATVTNFAGEEYIVECSLAGACAASGTSADKTQRLCVARCGTAAMNVISFAEVAV